MSSLKFIGKFKDLKALGFDHSTLYAEKKSVYSKEHMFIYKSGSSVSSSLFLEIDKVYQILTPLFANSDFDFSQLVERNEKLDKDFGINTFVQFFINDKEDLATFDKTEYVKEQKAHWTRFNEAHEKGVKPVLKPLLWKRVTVPIVELDVLKLLHDNKMIA